VPYSGHGRGVIENKHSTDGTNERTDSTDELTNERTKRRPSTRVYVSIHHERIRTKSCFDLGRVLVLNDPAARVSSGEVDCPMCVTSSTTGTSRCGTLGTAGAAQYIPLPWLAGGVPKSDVDVSISMNGVGPDR